MAVDFGAVGQLVTRYADDVRRAMPVDRAVLFGSYAKGTAHEYSDVDVCFFLEDFGDKRQVDIIKELLGLTHDYSDICLEPIAFPTSEIERGNPFVEEILRTGKDIPFAAPLGEDAVHQLGAADYEAVLRVVADYAATVRQAMPVDRAVLFGSYAKGNAREDSDIDVCFFLKDFRGKRRVDIITELLHLTRDYPLIDLEPIAFPTSEIERGNPFVEEILRTGRDIP